MNVTITVLFLLTWLASPLSSYGQSYLNLQPPGETPEVLAPGFISLEDEYEFSAVFSADGTEFFYGVDIGDRNEIRYTRLENGVWLPPVPLLQSDTYSYNDPFLSNDESRLYFIADLPFDGQGAPKDIDIWYIERTQDDWSEPINIGAPITTSNNEYYISFTETGTLFFATNKHETDPERAFNYDIYYAESEGDTFKEPVRLGDRINVGGYDADPFIEQDGSYLIFASSRRGGLGRGDLYISFMQDDGSWTKALNLGEPINTSGHELCPFVTRDGNYFVYTSNQDIYWLDARGMLSTYREKALAQGDEE